MTESELTKVAYYHCYTKKDETDPFDEVKDWCYYQDLTIKAKFYDQINPHYSKNEFRPGFADAISFARENGCPVVISNSSIFGKDLIEKQIILQLARDHKVEVLSSGEAGKNICDPEREHSSLAKTVVDVIGRYREYLHQQNQHVSPDPTSQEERIRTGNIPFGKLDEREEKVFREAEHMRKHQGMSWGKIANALNEREGMGPRHAAEWNYNLAYNAFGKAIK